MNRFIQNLISSFPRATSPSVMAGLGPAIHVDARHKAGHDRKGNEKKALRT
jgi:hypothetical protein